METGVCRFWLETEGVLARGMEPSVLGLQDGYGQSVRERMLD